MPAQLHQLHVDALIHKWRPAYAQSTLYTRAGILRKLLATLHDFGAPQLKVPRLKPGKPRPRIATQDEIDALMRIAPAHFRLFILLCWQTALRHSEALAVTPRSYDRANGTVSVRVKGGATRTIPVTADIAPLIESTLEGDRDQSCVFLLKGRKLAKASIYSAWARMCRACRIQGLRPHDLRRTTATQLYRVSHDIRAVQQYLGHDNLQSTTHYLAPLHEEQLREMQTLLNFHTQAKQ
jgi:integrase